MNQQLSPRHQNNGDEPARRNRRTELSARAEAPQFSLPRLRGLMAVGEKRFP